MTHRLAAILLPLLALSGPALANEKSSALIAEARGYARGADPNPDLAILTLQQARLADPADADAAFFLAGYALENFLYELSLSAAEAAQALDPARPNLHYIKGRALAGLGRHEAALAEYEAEPNRAGNRFYWFHRALAEKELGHHAAALESLDKAAAQNPAAAAAIGMQRGDLLVLQGQVAQSADAYRAAAAADPRSPVAGTIAERLSRLESARAAHPPFTGRLTLALEHDDNVGLFDNGVVRPPNVTDSDDLRVLTALAVDFRAYEGDGQVFGLSARGARTSYLSESDFDDGLLGAGAFWTIRRGVNFGGAAAAANMQWVDDDSHLASYAGTFYLGHDFGPRWRGIVSASATARNFLAPVAQPSRNRDGTVWAAEGSLSWKAFELGQGWAQLEAGGGASTEDSQGGFYDNDAWQARLEGRVPLRLWGETPGEVGAGLFWRGQDYDNPVQLASIPRLRQDDLFSQFIRLEHPLLDEIDLTAEYRHTENDSNAAGFGYDSNIISGGIVWRFGFGS